MISCPRTIICNNCEQMNVSGDVLNDGVNVVDQEDYGFTCSFLKVTPIVIDDTTKKKFIRRNKTLVLNNGEQQLKHPICENTD